MRPAIAISHNKTTLILAFDFWKIASENGGRIGLSFLLAGVGSREREFEGCSRVLQHLMLLGWVCEEVMGPRLIGP